MKLQLSKQYPFNFVAMAFKIAGREIDERALAKFDAYEVDAFLQERGPVEQAAIEWALADDDSALPDSRYPSAIAQTTHYFEQEYLKGRFGLVSLSDFNGLAMSWPQVEVIRDKINRFEDKDRFACHRCLFEVRDVLSIFIQNAKAYGRRNSAIKEEKIASIPVSELALDSYARRLLMDNSIKTVGDLTKVTADYLLSIRDFSEKRLARVRECLGEYNAHLIGE